MKRASFAILGLLVMGCRPSPTSSGQAAIKPESWNVGASAYAFARQAVLDDLAKGASPDAAGWTIPINSFEAGILQDPVDRSLYRITFSGSKPGFEIQTWTVTLRRSGMDWQLVTIDGSGSVRMFQAP